MNEIIYTEDELKDYSDQELLAILAKSWGVDDGKFEVWGELQPALGDKSHGYLRDSYLIKTGKKLHYPLQGSDQEACSFFVTSQDVISDGSKKKRRYIRCELELAPKAERIKHKNPLELCVKKGSGENLRYLPKEIPQEILIDPHADNERSQFIAKSIYDFYFEKARDDIDEEIKQKRSELEKKLSEQENEADKLIKKSTVALEKSEQKRDVVKKLVDTLNARQKELEQINEKLTQDKEVKHQEIQMLTKRFEQIEAEMNNKVKRLKSYVADKALFLKTFEFVDEEDLELFLLESKPESQRVDGISFSEILNGDYQKAVSYIQAHLVSKDILYPRHIIENYLTLLRTKDLIILAGDSGSGKTNLVKSFAKAVGGKSIIVPVKPNWTSSEDLLGYYNPLEKKYLATPFLEAMIEAQQNPEIPYFICLDEMNLARVEYYFADFLSLLETRDEDPEISLYAEDESAHVLSELKAVVDIIQSTKDKYSQNGVVNFIELLKDEKLNSQLRLAFGFSDKDSLIKYHNEIRRMLSAVMTMPSSIKMPANIHIIGAINIDETTHYLSPKILDRAHIMRFESPLLSDWDEILAEVSEYEFDDISKPLIFNIDALGYRANYPKFDRENPFCKLFIELNKEFFHKLGIEFGMRTIRQGLNYLDLFQDVNSDNEMAINNFLLHKVLPKLTFDGNKHVGEQTKLELIERVFVERLKQQLPNHENYSEIFSSIHALENVVRNAKANDGIVNFWS
ncbi:McrB family protein [Acinetobacter indicus]|uniref:McrB family protein n=2 Tax=Acinetobacter TaxID=469 RepID=UPI002578BD1C|nr:AAA family ATPase [Acinetobacter indicus]MDM1243717.1 AAA family ATPase [Acinetobacter indicus]MDM1287770.1 AAA family ATPase [Acinetobacter indicus]